MERFAFKIDNALKANLYKICRLCGIDNPAKVPILADNDDKTEELEGEPDLKQKIRELIGFTILKHDKMPQTMCSLCVDKINDFYEFREMCYATNTQTRKLLGLKPEEPFTQKINVKSETYVKVEAGNPKRARKRKSDEIPNNYKTEITTENELCTIKKETNTPLRKKKRLPHKEDPAASEQPKLYKKLRQKCTICNERFENKEKLDNHRRELHIPNIPRYFCNACDQIHNTNSGIRSHHLWHKLSKTPYKCGLCDQILSNNYSFTRHLREHLPVFPVQFQVFDRECPQCKAIFLTNFLYNTHRCAIRTRKCGGCSRYLRSEPEYLKHAAFCAKVYLKHSIHIPGEIAVDESIIRIKNENDIDETIDQDPSMQPYVSLERLASPIMREALSTTPSDAQGFKKLSKKDSKKSYFKRVDQLLKSTFDTLVSIKHEPEIHGNEIKIENEANDESSAYDNDDFHQASEHDSDNNEGDIDEGDDDDDDDDDGYGDGEVEDDGERKDEIEDDGDDGGDIGVDDNDENNVQNEGVKQFAVSDGVCKQHEIRNDNIKKEIIDNNEKEQYNRMIEVAHIKVEPKPFVLKLKITKERGQLNSSLVDDDENTLYEKKKKKKKRKDVDKERHKEVESAIAIGINSETVTNSDPNNLLCIKTERLDDGYENQRIATVMTSIPMTQFEITCTASDKETTTTDEAEDVKPNRLELDRLLQITHVAGGIIEPLEAVAKTKAIEDNAVQEQEPKMHKRAIARKSTGALQNINNNNNSDINITNDLASTNEGTYAYAGIASTTCANEENRTEPELPQIVAVQAGSEDLYSRMVDVVIKPEPCYRGYSDEMQAEESTNNEPPQTLNSTYNDEGKTYINTMDCTNIEIKKENELEVYDMQLDDLTFCNGELNYGQEEVMATNNVDGDNNIVIKKENELEVRDMQLDDLTFCNGELNYGQEEVMATNNVDGDNNNESDEETNSSATEQDKNAQVSDSGQPTIGLVITSVCGQAELPDMTESTQANNEGLNISNVKFVDHKKTVVYEQQISETTTITDNAIGADQHLIPVSNIVSKGVTNTVNKQKLKQNIKSDHCMTETRNENIKQEFTAFTTDHDMSEESHGNIKDSEHEPAAYQRKNENVGNMENDTYLVEATDENIVDTDALRLDKIIAATSSQNMNAKINGDNIMWNPQQKATPHLVNKIYENIEDAQHLPNECEAIVDQEMSEEISVNIGDTNQLENEIKNSRDLEMLDQSNINTEDNTHQLENAASDTNQLENEIGSTMKCLEMSKEINANIGDINQLENEVATDATNEVSEEINANEIGPNTDYEMSEQSIANVDDTFQLENEIEVNTDNANVNATNQLLNETAVAALNDQNMFENSNLQTHRRATNNNITDNSAQTCTILNEEAAAKCGNIATQKDVESQAQPIRGQDNITGNTSNTIETEVGINSDSEEEQQNLLNHELSVQNSIISESRQENVPVTCIQNEETDNRINEQQQQLLQQRQQQQSAPFLPRAQPQPQSEPEQFQAPPPVNYPDDRNINEIAENNNNANIERELQDDVHHALVDVPQDNDVST